MVSSRFFKEGKKMKLREMIRELEKIYCGTVGAEFMHIQNPRMRTWVLYKLENRDATPCGPTPPFTAIFLHKLYEAETFENFLHTKMAASASPWRAAKPSSSPSIRSSRTARARDQRDRHGHGAPRAPERSRQYPQ